MNPLEPFTLSLPKRRTRLRHAQPERVFQVQRCQLNNAGLPGCQMLKGPGECLLCKLPQRLLKHLHRLPA